MAQEVATKDKQAVAPASVEELEKQMMEDAGRGVSTDASDNIIPQISVLQPLSPEVLEGPGQFEGAKPGDFLLAGKSVVPGKTGIWFQPAAVRQVWLEFTPLSQGGGFVASHEFTGENVLPQGARRGEKMRVYFPDSGNECIHYRQLAGICWQAQIGLEYNISFKSTGHTIMREWNTLAMRSNRFANGSSRPFWGHVYHLTTVQKRNQAGQWYQINVGDPVLLSSPDAVTVVGDQKYAYEIGRALAMAFETQEKVAAAPVASGGKNGSAGDDIPF